MNEQEWIKKLEEEGYTEPRAFPIGPNDIPPEPHTHDQQTVHVILQGELVITDDHGSQTYKPGDRVDFFAGTTHTARTGPEGVKMIVGVKK